MLLHSGPTFVVAFFFYFSSPSPQSAPIKCVFGVEIRQKKTGTELEGDQQTTGMVECGTFEMQW